MTSKWAIYADFSGVTQVGADGAYDTEVEALTVLVNRLRGEKHHISTLLASANRKLIRAKSQAEKKGSIIVET